MSKRRRQVGDSLPQSSRLDASEGSRDALLQVLARADDGPQDAFIEDGDAPLDELLLTEAIGGAGPSDDLDLRLIEGASEIRLELPPRPAPSLEAPPPVATDDARAQLGNMPLFRSLGVELLQRLVERARIVELSEGQRLFEQGDPADALYIVARGAVVPITKDPPIRLSVLEEGSFFGEIGLITSAPRNASIEALVDTQLIVIDRSLVRRLASRDRNVLPMLLRFLRERVIDRLMQTSPFFAPLAEEERAELVSDFRLLEVRSNSQLIRQGLPAPALFVLLAGGARVILSEGDGDKDLATLEPGQFFGEMSLLECAPAVASVTTCGKCWLLALPRGRFESLIERDEVLSEQMKGVALMRHHENRRRAKDGTPLPGELGLL